MSDRLDVDGELEPQDRELGELLQAGRPAAGAGFRGALGRHLAQRDPGYGPRPGRLRTISAAYLGVGLAMMTLGALQAIGVL